MDEPGTPAPDTGPADGQPEAPISVSLAAALQRPGTAPGLVLGTPGNGQRIPPATDVVPASAVSDMSGTQGNSTREGPTLPPVVVTTDSVVISHKDTSIVAIQAVEQPAATGSTSGPGKEAPGQGARPRSTKSGTGAKSKDPRTCAPKVKKSTVSSQTTATKSKTTSKTGKSSRTTRPASCPAAIPATLPSPSVPAAVPAATDSPRTSTGVVTQVRAQPVVSVEAALPAGPIIPLDPGFTAQDFDSGLVYPEATGTGTGPPGPVDPPNTVTSVNTPPWSEPPPGPPAFPPLFSYNPGSGEPVFHRIYRQVAEESAQELRMQGAWPASPAYPTQPQWQQGPYPSPSHAHLGQGYGQSGGAGQGYGPGQGLGQQPWHTPATHREWSAPPSPWIPPWGSGSTPTTTTPSAWTTAGSTVTSTSSTRVDAYGNPVRPRHPWQHGIPQLDWGSVQEQVPQWQAPVVAEYVIPPPPTVPVTATTTPATPKPPPKVPVSIQADKTPTPHYSPITPVTPASSDGAAGNTPRTPAVEETTLAPPAEATEPQPETAETQTAKRRRHTTTQREPPQKSLDERFAEMEARLLQVIAAQHQPTTSKPPPPGPRIYRGRHPRSRERVEAGSHSSPEPPVLTPMLDLEPPDHPGSPYPTDEDGAFDTDAPATEEEEDYLDQEDLLEPITVQIKIEPDSDVEVLDSSPQPTPALSRVAAAAAKIDQASLRSAIKVACKIIGKEPGKLPDHAHESSSASGLSSLRYHREHGMNPSPEEKVAWPHDDALDRTQGDCTATLQHLDGPYPADDLFSIPPPPKTADKFLPLPAKKQRRDQWYYMAQTAPKSSWAVKPPVSSNVEPGIKAPTHYSVPHGQHINQEANLRHLSHLATVANNASVAVSEVLFRLFNEAGWLEEPISHPGVPEPVTMEWFIAMFGLIGNATTQMAHNAVSAAMNLQLIRRDAYIATAGNAIALSPADRDLLKVAPMNSEDLFGRQAAHLQERKDLWLQHRTNRCLTIAGRNSLNPGSSGSQGASTPQKSGGRKRSRSNNRSGNKTSPRAQQSASYTPPPFRPGGGRGQGGNAPPNRGRGTPRRGGTGAGRGAPRSGAK